MIRFAAFTLLILLTLFITWSGFMYWFSGTVGIDFTENYPEDIKGFLKSAIIPSISSGLVATIASYKAQKRRK